MFLNKQNAYKYARIIIIWGIFNAPWYFLNKSYLYNSNLFNQLLQIIYIKEIKLPTSLHEFIEGVKPPFSLERDKQKIRREIKQGKTERK